MIRWPQLLTFTQQLSPGSSPVLESRWTLCIGMNKMTWSLICTCCPVACSLPDRLLAFLLPRLDTSNERTRVGTLQVVRHVINSAGECLHASPAATPGHVQDGAGPGRFCPSR